MKKVFYFILSLLLTACDALLDVDSRPDEMGSPSVFDEDATALAAIRGIYAEMASVPYFSNGGIALLTGLSSDELVPMGTEYRAFYNADLKPEEPLLKEYLWSPAYRTIYNANMAIEGLRNSKGVSSDLREQLLGEALFIRAFCHFYLTNLFGSVPLLTTADVEQNGTARRTVRSVVYDTTAADLAKAVRLLAFDKFAFTTTEPGRIRPTTWAASALLARLFLYQGKWAMAEAEATRVIEEDLFSLESVEGTFKVASREAIWQLKANTPGIGSWDAMLFIPAEGSLSVALRPEILEAFTSADKRRKAWIDSLNIAQDMFYYPAKYKSQYREFDEYHVELRLSELFLIRAEARANLNDFTGAIADIDVVRGRAGVALLAESGKKYTLHELMNAVVHERRTELFAESGHRWFDLGRLDRADSVLGALSNRAWQGTDIFYPIPQSEIELNRNLLPQNEGY